MNDIRVHMKHIWQMHCCSRGARIWAQRHGIDYTKFLREGVPVETLEATGDAFALAVCKIARAEAAKYSEVNNGQ